MRSACPRRVSRSVGSAPHSAKRVEPAAARSFARCLLPSSSPSPVRRSSDDAQACAPRRGARHRLCRVGVGVAGRSRVGPRCTAACSDHRAPTPPRHDADAGGAPTAPRMVHGGPRHLHRSAAHGPRTAKVGWRVKVDGPVAAQVTASPDERTLYVGTLAGSLVALARDDGKQRWSAALGERVYSTPLVARRRHHLRRQRREEADRALLRGRGPLASGGRRRGRLRRRAREGRHHRVRRRLPRFTA